MSTKTQEAVISNKALVVELESKLDSVTPEAKTILEDTIFRIKNIGKFLKRGTLLTIEQAPELVINETNIRQSLEKVIEREKDRLNTFEVCIDHNIWNWDVLKGKTMPGIEKQFNATIHRFTQTITHAKIREEADKLSVKKDWNISEAWNIVIAGILAGEVDVKRAGIFAYFTVKVNSEDVLYRFSAFRINSNDALYVTVYEVFQDYEQRASNGVALSS